MPAISTFLTQDHRHCDKMFAAAEDAGAKHDWNRSSAAFTAFCQAIEHHFRMEEEVMFPAFEEQTGMNDGPTMMMRMEHEQMRGLMQQMHHDVETCNANDYLGHADTLLVLMQQHNAKEEQILYPLADQALAARQEAIVADMHALDAEGKPNP